MEEWLKDYERGKGAKTVGDFRHGRTELQDDLKEELEKFLEMAKDWERTPTSKKGVFVIKIPAPRQGGSESLALEINPVGENSGLSKKKGLILTSREQYEGFKALINDERVEKLVDLIDKAFSRRKKEKSQRVIEI